MVLLPAPVVPPALLDDSTAGDCVTVRSWPLMVRSSSVALESTKPKFEEGMDWAKSKKVSG